MTNAPPPIADPPPSAPPPPGASAEGVGGQAFLSLIIGVVFLYLGWPAAPGLLHPSKNPHNVVWSGDHPRAGEPVPYFELEYGAAWVDTGALATAVVLLGEAAAYAMMTGDPDRRRRLAGVVIGLGAVGCCANVVSAAMQLKAGFTGLPLYALIGLAMCGLSIASARPLRA